ncbi:hypothetical protein DKP76_07355 [Falsochrobactrum shanghaiense]|uniref:Uncharacterized protein n=1 Tax=Falsochrobactrum shanghaiense TaxID=2201899 RepID=A0A316JE16_9HYPH|nr:hypothetical protein [Falsochrobactrum shanghaiense]PWL18869.1 hypothetical protein DKP76_07355 [Falsochrobactrum shanghaiense]
MVSDEAVKAADKSMADSIGHGMREKCLDHALAALTAAAPYMQGAAREQALDLSVLERLAKVADDYDEPDEIGPFPDIQDAMITVRDLRQIRKLLAAIRALSSPDHADAGKSVEAEAARTLLNGDQGKIYAACEGISRVYKFTEVLERIALEGAE